MMRASLPACEPAPPHATPHGRSKRLLIVARWPVGGIRTHLKENYPAVVRAGYPCTLVVPGDASWESLQEVLRDIPAQGIPVADCGRGFTLANTLAELLDTGAFDLIHAHGLTAAAHTALATLGREVPFVVTVHEPLRPGQFASLVGMGKRWLLGRALGRAQAIITVSNDARDNLLRFFPNLRRTSCRIHTIPNGIDTTRYAPLATGTRGQARTSGAVRIGFLGRFMPEKGFGLLIEAVARLVRHGSTRAFQVIAVGSGDYRREYEKQIQRFGLAERIQMRDLVPDVRPLLEQLDLVVVPSLWEASSLVSMEAMCAGVPVLGADCPGLREVLRDTPARMFATADISALESALREALAYPWNAAAQDYAPVARERFDNRRSAARLVGLYDALTVKPVPAAA